MFPRLTVLSRQSALLLALLLASVMNVEARNYALLVGVSNYPNLEQKFQLAGPDNDVRLMKSVLRQLKVEERDITALFSANDKRPTKANIVAELRQLATKTTAEDFVFLHFAGHGSRQPARAGDTEEEDNLDEIFLPEDVGNWSDEIGAVERAITDNEINHLITAIRANGTFVWAVFDSCHSGTMLRSVGRIKWRKVDPSALGIPSGRNKRQRRQGRLPSPLDVTAAASSPPAGQKAPVTGSKKPGGFVAFYAAQSHELAPELQMPPNAASPSSHGLFSYQLAQAMMAGAGLTYRQLGQVILQKYVTQGMRATTPLFEGTHLDAPMFGRDNQQLTHQWPVRIRGSRNRSLFIPAGELQQIGKGAVFAVLENASDSDEKAIGYAKAGLVELFGTQLIPVAYDDKAVFDLAKLPRSAYARMIKPAFQFGLSVAMPSLADAKTSREVRVAKIINQMFTGQGGTGGGMENAKSRNGLQIDWRKAGSAADIHLVFSPPKGTASQAETGKCRRNHLWFLDRTGALICSGSKANLSFRLQNPSADFDFNVRRELTKWLNAIGKVRNLEQMVERFKGGRFARKIKIKLMVKKAGESKERIVDQSSRQPLSAGDALRLEISNSSSSPVDLTILFVDSRYGIVSLFPTSGRTNRISAKGKIANIGGKITADTLGLEGMIVIASKAAPGTPVADFRFLAQKKLSRTKNVRALGGARPPSEPALGAVEELFASAAFGGKRGGATRSAGKKNKRVRTPFKSVAIKSMRWIVGSE